MDEGILRLFEEQKKSPSTQVIGYHIKSFDSVTSTNDVAFDLALKGSADGMAVFASTQTKGRGRLNREWVSIPDKGIYLSLILRPIIRPDEAQEITLMSALSAVKTIREITSLPALVKWPNDVLINDKKVCGILTEMDAEADRVKFLIVGIGINVNTEQKDLPDTATSLKEVSKKEVELDKFLLELLKQLDKYYAIFKQNKSAIINECKEFMHLWGKRIKIKTLDKEIEGQAIDLDERGALIIRLDNGFLERVLSGDVLLIS